MFSWSLVSLFALWCFLRLAGARPDAWYGVPRLPKAWHYAKCGVAWLAWLTDVGCQVRERQRE